MESTSMDRSSTCCVCFQTINDQNQYIFQPCCHTSICQECQVHIPVPRICPVCRAPEVIQEWNQLFIDSFQAGHAYPVKICLQLNLINWGIPVSDGEIRGCLPGCVNPECGLHHYLCPNHAMAHMPSGALMLEDDAMHDSRSLLLIASTQNFPTIVSILLEMGLNPNQSFRGIPPLYMACERGNLAVVKILHQSGAVMTQVTTGCHCGWIDASDPVCPEDESGDDSHLPSCEQDGYSPLYVACEVGHRSVMEYLIETVGLDLNQEDQTGNIPLIAVLENRDHRLENLTYLLEQGANPNAVNKRGITAFYQACRDLKLEEMKILLAHGADPQSVGKIGEVFYDACRNNPRQLDIVKYLLEQNLVNPNDLTDHGFAALHGIADSWQCRGIHDCDQAVMVTNLLLEHGANPDILSDSKTGHVTPFFQACAWGNLPVARCYLERHAQVGLPDSGGNTPFLMACHGGYLSVVTHLWHLRNHHDLQIHAPDQQEVTPFHESCLLGHLDVVEFLFHHQFDVRQPDHRGKTPLHGACLSGHDSVVQFLLQQESTRQDLNRQATQEGDAGCTPLWYACQEGHLVVVKLLVACPEIEMEVPGCREMSPFHVAVYKGQVSVTKFLLQQGVKINTCGYWHKIPGWTPLHHAGLMVKNSPDKIEQYLAIVKFLLDQEATDIHVTTGSGDTALLLACESQSISLVELLYHRYERDLRTRNRQVRVHVRVSDYHTGMRLCLNRPNEKGFTPFHGACLRGDVEMVRFLLQNTDGMPLGSMIDPSCPNQQGLTPLKSVQNAIEEIQALSEEESAAYLNQGKNPQERIEKLQAIVELLTAHSQTPRACAAAAEKRLRGGD